MSSRRAIRRRECLGKVRHSSVAAATVAAHRTRGRVHAYRCPSCGGYHVGHAPRRMRQAMAARLGLLTGRRY